MESERITLSNCPRELKKSVDAISILVVDDDTTCLSIVAAILKKFKYEVVTVKHANDALCTLRIKGGAFDLVVSDVHMPDMNGFELQQAIAQEFNLPVVLMSADDKEGVALKGLESGAAFFIYKPVSPDDVRDLWQFASMKKKSQVVIEETEEKTNCDETTISVSSSSVNEDRVSNKRDSKKKFPRREGSDAKKGETSQSAASQKKPKVIWTNSLHNRFLEAIRSIGLDRAVPKKILEVMNVPGLTRENVASHLQKYRIFLRRVSDASYKIQYSADHKGLSKNLFRSSLQSSLATTSPSTLLLNRFNKFPYQIPGQYFPNPEASSSSTLINQSGFRQSRLHSNKAISPGLKLNIGNAHLIHQNNDRPCVKLTHNGFQGPPSMQLGHISNISLEDLSSAVSATINPTNTSSDNIGTPNIISSMPISKDPAYQTNYVGYSISNIKHLADSEKYDQGLNYYTNNVTAVPNNADNYTNTVDDQHVEACDNSFVVGNINGAGEQLSDVIADYRVLQLSSNLPNLHHCGTVGNGGPIIHESAYSPMFDMSEFDALSAQQTLEEVDFDTTLADQVNIQNQAQQNEGETFTTSNFYGGTSHGNNCAPSFDQAPNQQQYCSQDLVKSQDFGTSSQLNNTIIVPPNERVREGLTNSLGFGTSSQLLAQNLLSPIEQRDDDDFLESLLAPFGEDQTLEGI